jgi:hypothetical protein
LAICEVALSFGVSALGLLARKACSEIGEGFVTMKSRFFSALAITLLASGAANAVATVTTTDWGVHSLGMSATGQPVPGSFEDFYTFSYTASSLTSGLAVLPVFVGGNAFLSIIDGSYSLWAAGANTAGTGLGDGDDTNLVTWNFSAAAATVVQTYTPTAAGNYFYRVAGNATGSAGGMYVLSSALTAAPAMPIPEPQTYAMLLAGLGVIGFMALRRRKS